MNGEPAKTPAGTPLPPAVRRGQGVPLSGVALACHIGHISPWMHLHIWAKGVKVKRQGLQPPQLQGAKRKEINGLSTKARARLLWCAENTPALNGEGMMFVTLTYPGEYPKDGRQVKRDLDAFGKRVRRLGGYFLWVLEYQTRGAPHFHLLARFPGAWDILHIREWVAVSWFQVVGSGDEKHLNAGTGVEKVKNPQAAGYYMSQYAGKWEQKKIPEGVTLPGKMWGLVGCKMPKPEIMGFKADDRKGIELVRVVRRAAASDYAFHQRQRIMPGKERATIIKAIVKLGEQTIFAKIDFIHELISGCPVVAIPVYARRAWHPRDRGRDAGFSVRNGAAALRQYLNMNRRIKCKTAALTC